MADNDTPVPDNDVNDDVVWSTALPGIPAPDSTDESSARAVRSCVRTMACGLLHISSTCLHPPFATGWFRKRLGCFGAGLITPPCSLLSLFRTAELSIENLGLWTWSHALAHLQVVVAVPPFLAMISAMMSLGALLHDPCCRPHMRTLFVHCVAVLIP